MYILGLSGSTNPVFANDNNLPMNVLHDAACVLLKDGKVVCAVEEERLNRIKHTNKFPVESIKYCLAMEGLAVSDLDLIAINFSSDVYTEGALPGEFCASVFKREFGVDVDRRKFHFVHHHHAHAMSAYGWSGFTNALVATFDGQGEAVSGLVMRATESGLEELVRHPERDSIGLLYLWVTWQLGFGNFDEYKVMGLAPYGDPAKYRDVLASMYKLMPDGGYTMSYGGMSVINDILSPRREAHEPITQVHQDFAAALQEAVEVVLFHSLRHWQKKTGERNLALAGGVAHNCVANGKLARSGLFDQVFVQPAAYDAGGALGAALYAYQSLVGNRFRTQPLTDVYWGPDIPRSEETAARLTDWNGVIQFEKRTDIFADAARMLADGKVIGWVQGRSEFGPRALGNRSILADPRPASNKDRINAMVKKREAFRPFAPSVPAELADQYFDLCSDVDQLAYMNYTVDVKPEMRELLGAVTHVDGTARIQTVNRKTNERFWRLLMEFHKITSVPVLLNTSFNNNAEPIVDSVDDALACFLTTGLDVLVIDDFLITKKAMDDSDYMKMSVSLRPFESLHRTFSTDATGHWTSEFQIRVSYDPRTFSISEQVFNILVASMSEAKQKRLADVMESIGNAGHDKMKTTIQELAQLWSKRLVVIQPIKGNN